MQYTHKELYEETSQKNNIPLNKVKFVGDIVFGGINKNLDEPDSIILKIKHIGKFFIRRNKLEQEITLLKIKIDECTDEAKELTLRRRLARMQDRSAEYSNYVADKQRIKKLRHENQKPLESPLQEEEI